jgi:hypothetical protein
MVGDTEWDRYHYATSILVAFDHICSSFNDDVIERDLQALMCERLPTKLENISSMDRGPTQSE